MKRNVKRILAEIFVVVLTVFLVVMELSLRFVWHFSQTTKNYIKGLIESHPIPFGSLWVILMVSAVCLAFIKYREKKTKSTLVVFIIWLACFVILLLSGLYYIS